eukprot:COSAG02_NODE_11711_length_1670_cov_1.063017_2_plen_165_part_00
MHTRLEFHFTIVNCSIAQRRAHLKLDWLGVELSMTLWRCLVLEASRAYCSIGQKELSRTQRSTTSLHFSSARRSYRKRTQRWRKYKSGSNSYCSLANLIIVAKFRIAGSSLKHTAIGMDFYRPNRLNATSLCPLLTDVLCTNQYPIGSAGGGSKLNTQQNFIAR